MSDIQLKREAGELREQAHAELDTLKTRIARQRKGELGEGETKLSHEEIAEQRKSIEEKFSEAKELEGLNRLEDIFNRPADELSPNAKGLREILQSAVGSAPQDGEEPKVFKTVGEFMRAVRAQAGSDYDGHELSDVQRAKLSELAKGATLYEKGEAYKEKSLAATETTDLNAVKEALGVKTLTGESGGGAQALVPTVHMAELLRAMGEGQAFAQRARRVPMQRRTIDFPRLKQTDATDTRPMFGFAAVAKIAEGAEKPEREPEFEQFTLTAVKYASYLEAGDELLDESIIATQPLLVELLTDSIAYEYDRDCMRGDGSGEPQGFIGSDAEWVQNRTTASEINIDDIFGLESRFFGTGGVYMYHPSAIPQLYGLASDNLIVWNPDLATGAPGTLLGRPLVSTHKLPTLGNKGDLCLVDPSFYIAGDLQRITVASSIHFKFRNDVTAWRAVFRAAGSPWPAGLFSHEASGGSMTYRVSPFTVLGPVASS